MKISQLIQRLEWIQKEQGDLNIYIQDADTSDCFVLQEKHLDTTYNALILDYQYSDESYPDSLSIPDYLGD